MKAQGMLFMSKSKPVVNQLAGGGFQLTLLAVNRLGHHQSEAWRLIWVGPAAHDFYIRASQWLTAGQPLNVTASQIRSHHCGGHYTEIHAQVETLGLGVRAHTAADAGINETTEAA